MSEYNDYPVRELVESAEEVISENLRKGVACHVFFKATCPWCGARPMFQEPNTVYPRMECSECGKEFDFVKGNYMVVMSNDGELLREMLEREERIDRERERERDRERNRKGNGGG